MRAAFPYLTDVSVEVEKAKNDKLIVENEKLSNEISLLKNKKDTTSVDKQFEKQIEKLKTEIDFKKRADLTREALLLDQADVGHIPLHHQVIPWAMRKNVTVVHRSDNGMWARWAIIQ